MLLTSTRLNHSKAPDFHGSPLIIAWLVIVNLTILISVLRWWKYSFFIHMILGMIIVGLSIAAIVPFLQLFWLGSSNDSQLLKIHMLIGFIVILWLGVQIFTGFIAHFIQFSNKISTNLTIWTKKIHYFFSYCILLLAKSNYLNIYWIHKTLKPGFIVLLLIDIICLAIYLLIKFKYWTLSEDIVDAQVKLKTQSVPNNFIFKVLYDFKSLIFDIKKQIQRNNFDIPRTQNLQQTFSSQKQIPISKYVIFNDYVYDIQEFQHKHPGGEYVMHSVNKREIDRFIYGMYSYELTPNVSVHSHSRNSLSLCGQPVGKIQRNSPMSGFNGYLKASIFTINAFFQSSSTYLIHLKPSYSVKDNMIFRFDGYTSQQQFGQYFSLTITNYKGRDRCTRLYTAIWSQRKENISLMNKYFPESSIFKYISGNYDKIDLQLKAQDRNLADIVTIPLVMKKYESGELTSKLLNPKFDGSIILSQPMGSGMKYLTLATKGKIIIVCAGTGILPFCDFIDILFKRVKFLQNPRLEFKSRDPLIDVDFIKERQFLFYCAAESHTDLPPLSIYQINELCGAKILKFKSSFKLNSNQLSFVKQYSNIQLHKGYFDEEIRNAIDSNICQIYVCGPPAMNASIGKIIIDKNVSKQLYHYM